MTQCQGPRIGSVIVTMIITGRELIKHHRIAEEGEIILRNITEIKCIKLVGG